MLAPNLKEMLHLAYRDDDWTHSSYFHQQLQNHVLVNDSDAQYLYVLLVLRLSLMRKLLLVGVQSLNGAFQVLQKNLPHAPFEIVIGHLLDDDLRRKAFELA